MVSFKILRLEHVPDMPLKTVRFVQIFLVALLFCVPALRAQEATTATGPLVTQSSESEQVWVNTASGVYHYPGTRWFGKTKQGEFMSEAEAKSKGIPAS